MTIKECIDIVDDLKPNQYSIKVKVMWLSFIDEIIINDVLKTHTGYDGRYDNFTGYSEDKLSVPLIVASPYDRLYTAYLKMKIDAENGETARYNNSAGLFNSYMMEYRKFYNKTHIPLSNADREKANSKSTKLDVTEAQLEFLKRELYPILAEDINKAVSDDKIYDIVMNYVNNNIELLAGIVAKDVNEALETISSVKTANGTVVSQNADFAEVAEWADGNPNNEDRTGYFVCADVPVNGIIMKKATSIDDVKGVSILAPAFAGNYSKDKVDSNGNLLPKYSYVAIIGFVPVIDNGTCTVGGRCMPDDNGCAIPSSNSMGYQIVKRIDEKRVLIIIEPNGDMVQRVKTKINEINQDLDSVNKNLENVNQDLANVNKSIDSLENANKAVANAIKVNLNGTAVAAHDVSPVEHDLGVKVERKNLLNIQPMLSAENWEKDEALNSGGYWNYPITGLLPNTTYTISMKENGFSGVADNGLYVSIRNTVGTWYDPTSLCHTSGTSYWCPTIVNVTTNESGILYLCFYNPTDAKLERFFSNCPEMMLELGSTATTYAPYVEDLSSVKVQRYGLNLLPFPYSNQNKTKYYDVGYTYETNGITYTVLEQGRIKAVGTATGSANFTIGTFNNPLIKLDFKTYSATQHLSFNTNYNFVFVHISKGTTIDTILEPMIFVKGANSTIFEPYIEPQTVTANADGTVEGLTSISPNMTLIPDTEGVIVDCEYNADTKMYIDNKFAELATALVNNS